MTADVALAAQGRFTGDPSHEYEHTETRTEGEGDEATEVEVTVRGLRDHWDTRHRWGYNKHEETGK